MRPSRWVHFWPLPDRLTPTALAAAVLGLRDETTQSAAWVSSGCTEVEVACLRLQNRLHHFPTHIRQPELAALELVRQPHVIDAQAVQNRGLQIVHVDRIFR